MQGFPSTPATRIRRVSWVLILGCALAPGGAAGGASPSDWGRAGRDSVVRLVRGRGEITPVARLAHPRLNECSGLACLGDAYFAHNDSGDLPLLYRSRSLDFSDAEVLLVPGALAVDWEDITVLDGDLLIGDIGDNRRERSEVVLYRVRYESIAARATGGARAGPTPVAGKDSPGDPTLPSNAVSGRASLVAVYPFRYPDGPHDAEALAVIDGRVHVISKAREEAFTGVYRFDTLKDRRELAAGEVNVPVLLDTLDLGAGEQATAADFDPRSRTLLILTYGSIQQYRAGQLSGRAHWTTTTSMQQCEALCLDGRRLLVANEQREVYGYDGFLERRYTSLLPVASPEEETP